eukprot:974070-Pyramimonas_sp.AAC.1
MAYFYQWLYWRSADPIADALRGRRAGPQAMDMAAALGQLRGRLKDAVGERALADAGEAWFEAVVDQRNDLMPDSPCRKRKNEKCPPIKRRTGNQGEQA